MKHIYRLAIFVSLAMACTPAQPAATGAQPPVDAAVADTALDTGSGTDAGSGADAATDGNVATDSATGADVAVSGDSAVNGDSAVSGDSAGGDATGFDVVPPQPVALDETPLPAGVLDVPELLGRPAATSIALSLVPTEPLELYVEMGKSASMLDKSSPAASAAAHLPTVLTLDGLSPDTRHWYRLRWRKPGQTAYETGPVRTFHTQRAVGQTFTFTVQSDSHLDENTILDQYRRTLDNIRADVPDFHLDLGDTFMCEKHAEAFTPTVKAAPDAATVQARYQYEREHFGRIGPWVPLLLANGNHEGEFGYLATPQGNDVATWATKARKTWYLDPQPDAFFSGDAQQYQNVGLRGAWYAWQWGDALFVVLDPFWNTKTKNKDGWAITLGKPQYDWLQATLQGSKAKWKFLFLHNLVGGLDGQMRGGLEAAPYFEWGGANADGTPGFAAQRPGWGDPIHALLVKHKVTAVFHGHDHLYANQVLDGVVYQAVPQPSAKNTNNGAQLAQAYHYLTGTTMASAGHLRVTVGPQGVLGEYVRAWLPAGEKSGHKNGEIAHSWTVQP